MDLALLDDRLHLIPGLRIDPYFVSVNRRAPTKGTAPAVGLFDMTVFVEPRLSLEYKLSERVGVKRRGGFIIKRR